jgi:hypothetical protein
MNPTKIVHSANDIEWRLNGELHKEDGPAIEFPNGNKMYCFHGQSLSEEEFENCHKNNKD